MPSKALSLTPQGGVSRRRGATHRRLSPWTAAACLLLGGCNLELMPIDDPTPRSFVVPRLLRQCMAGFKAPTPITIEDPGALEQIRNALHS